MEEQLLKIDQELSHINKNLREVTGEKVYTLQCFQTNHTDTPPQVKLDMRLQYMKTKYFESKKKTQCIIC